MMATASFRWRSVALFLILPLMVAGCVEIITGADDKTGDEGQRSTVFDCSNDLAFGIEGELLAKYALNAWATIKEQPTDATIKVTGTAAVKKSNGTDANEKVITSSDLFTFDMSKGVAKGIYDFTYDIHAGGLQANLTTGDDGKAKFDYISVSDHASVKRQVEVFRDCPGPDGTVPLRSTRVYVDCSATVNDDSSLTVSWKPREGSILGKYYDVNLMGRRGAYQVLTSLTKKDSVAPEGSLTWSADELPRADLDSDNEKGYGYSVFISAYPTDLVKDEEVQRTSCSYVLPGPDSLKPTDLVARDDYISYTWNTAGGEPYVANFWHDVIANDIVPSGRSASVTLQDVKWHETGSSRPQDAPQKTVRVNTSGRHVVVDNALPGTYVITLLTRLNGDATGPTQKLYVTVPEKPSVTPTTSPSSAPTPVPTTLPTTIPDPPKAVDDNYDSWNIAANQEAQLPVTANDTCPDGCSVIEVQPITGSPTLLESIANGKIRFKAPAGSYTFSYKLRTTYTVLGSSYNLDSDAATVTVTVLAADPTITTFTTSVNAVADDWGGPLDETFTATCAATDPSGGTLTYALTGNGTITNTGTGTWAVNPNVNATGNETYTCAATSSNGGAGSATKSVAVSIDQWVHSDGIPFGGLAAASYTEYVFTASATPGKVEVMCSLVPFGGDLNAVVVPMPAGSWAGGGCAAAPVYNQSWTAAAGGSLAQVITTTANQRFVIYMSNVNGGIPAAATCQVRSFYEFTDPAGVTFQTLTQLTPVTNPIPGAPCP